MRILLKIEYESFPILFLDEEILGDRHPIVLILTIRKKVLVLLSCDFPLGCRHLACNLDPADGTPASQ